MATLRDRFDGMVVISNVRCGSTVLCDSLNNWLRDLGCDPLYLHEWLAPHQFVSGKHIEAQAMALRTSGSNFKGGHIRVDQRPCDASIAESKLRYLADQRKHRFTLFKLMTFDLYAGNDRIVDRWVISDQRTCKIGLNRRDVGNALISWLIGYHHNIWGGNAAAIAEQLRETFTPVEVTTDMLQFYVKLVVDHNQWLLCNVDALDHLAWFHDLNDLHMPILGYHGALRSGMINIPDDHITRAKRYLINADEVLDFAQRFQETMSPMISAVEACCQRKGWM